MDPTNAKGTAIMSSVVQLKARPTASPSSASLHAGQASTTDGSADSAIHAAMTRRAATRYPRAITSSGRLHRPALLIHVHQPKQHQPQSAHEIPIHGTQLYWRMAQPRKPAALRH